MTDTVKVRVRELLSDGTGRTVRQIAYELEPSLPDYKETAFFASIRNALNVLEYWGQVERIDSDGCRAVLWAEAGA